MIEDWGNLDNMTPRTFLPDPFGGTLCKGDINLNSGCMQCENCIKQMQNRIDEYNKIPVSVDEQREKVAEVLSALKMIDGEAILAGGAPRNWQEGKIANDYDIYLRSFADLDSRKWKQLEMCMPNMVLEKLECLDTSLYNSELNIITITNIRIDGHATPFQLIYIKPEQDFGEKGFQQAVLEHMDIGINQVGYSDDPSCTSMLSTAAYRKDRQEETLTVIRGNQTFQQLRHTFNVHLPKMVEYYPDHMVILK
ncbi:hypothetical protein N9937_00995 [bacterium]|nr:hypothetical protein [bacterium]